MKDFSLYVVDFEGSLQTGILEYGIVEVSSTKGILNMQTQFCKNRSNISSLEQQCHHLNDEQLSSFASFENHLDVFIKARQRTLFCAHNASFENTLLSSYLPMLTIPSPTGNQQHVWGPWLDTYYLYKKHLKIPLCGLKDLVEMFQLTEILANIAEKFCPSTRKNFHCALYDAIACSLLFLNFIRLPEIQSKSFDWLLMTSSPLKIVQQLQQPYLF